MPIHSAAYDQYLAELLAAEADSADHRLAETVAAIQDDDNLLNLLFAMYTQDPKNTREFAIAAHLLSLVYGPEATA
ncbi:hypothetical protein [Nocardia sp. Marseille-Q1738]